MVRATTNKSVGADEQLQSFIAKFDPKHRAVIRAARKALRKRFPTATELVYDNYNFFVIGFGPTEHPSDCIVSIAAGASGVGLCFIRGASLPDPAKVLLGSGKQTRFIRLPSPQVLDWPAVQALLTVAAKPVEDAAASEQPPETCHSFSIRKAATSPQTAKGLTK